MFTAIARVLRIRFLEISFLQSQRVNGVRALRFRFFYYNFIFLYRSTIKKRHTSRAGVVGIIIYEGINGHAGHEHLRV